MSPLEAELRRTQPGGSPPADLHVSIVRAVRAAGAAPVPPPTPLPWRWLAATALIALAAWVAWWSQPPPASHDLAAAGSALEETGKLPQVASAAMLAPLSQEMEYLNRDFKHAVDFLVASVP